MPLYNFVVRFHLECCFFLMVMHVLEVLWGERFSRIECESISCKTKRLLLAYFRKRKTEKHVLSSKSVRGILQGVGRKMYVVDIYQNMKVPEESSTKNGNDKLYLSCGIQCIYEQDYMMVSSKAIFQGQRGLASSCNPFCKIF